MDGLTSLMQGAQAQQPMQQQPMQQQPMQQQPMQGMNPAMSNAIEVVNNDVENLNLDPRTEYALKIQEASDLLKAAERNLAMSQSQPTPPEVVDQRKQQVQQQIQGGIGGLLQQLTPGMQQRGMQMAAAAAPQMQGGLPTQSAPNMVNMSQGGIIGYADGGEVYDDIGAMAALHKQASDKMSDPNASIQAKANAQQDINMVRQQAGNRYGQVMRRVDEMRGLPPLEMAMGGQVKRYANGGSTPTAEDYLRQAIRQERVTDPAVIAFLEALYAQESSSGANVQDSPSGAQGPMQVMPGTFTEMADENWDPNDPMAQTRAGVRYALQGLDAADGDAQLAAQYYYGGPSALNNPDISDPNNPNFPTTGEYGNGIVQRIAEQANLRNAQDSVMDVPKALNNSGSDFGEAGLAGLADTIAQQQQEDRREEETPEGQAKLAEEALEARRALVTRARDLRVRMGAGEINQEAYNSSIRQIERDLSGLTDLTDFPTMQIPETPAPTIEEQMGALIPEAASAELNRQLTKEYGQGIGSGVGVTQQQQEDKFLQSEPGQNWQDQRIAALREAPSNGTYESIANLLTAGRDYVMENPLETAGYALTALPVAGAGFRAVTWAGKLLMKSPKVASFLVGLGILNRDKIESIINGEEELPPEAVEALLETDLSQFEGVDAVDIEEGQNIVNEESTGEVTDPEEVVTETTGEGTPRERQFNLDNLISGLLAAGNATSTSQALRGYGVGSQAETQRQEGIAREEREARLLAQNRLNELETQYRLRSVELARELEGSMDEERFKAAQTIMGDINNRMDSNFEDLVATEAKRILEDGGTGLLGRITGDDKKRAEQQARINLMRGYVLNVLKMTGAGNGNTPTRTADDIIAEATRLISTGA